MTLFEPAILLPGDPPHFPDPGRADEDGLVAIGGDLSVERLVAAYRTGIFPWYDSDTPPLWWSPDPRGVLDPQRLHVSRRLARHARASRVRYSWNRSFTEVMEACGEGRDDGTWILPEMKAAYARLHTAGYAHSLEVWHGEELIGGLYGVQIGALFAAESKFHRTTDASKLALVAATRSLVKAGVALIDVQMLTPHLASLGAEEWERRRYLATIRSLVDRDVNLIGLEPGWEP